MILEEDRKSELHTQSGHFLGHDKQRPTYIITTGPPSRIVPCLSQIRQPETIRGKWVSSVRQKTGQVTWAVGSGSVSGQAALERVLEGSSVKTQGVVEGNSLRQEETWIYVRDLPVWNGRGQFLITAKALAWRPRIRRVREERNDSHVRWLSKYSLKLKGNQMN